MKKLASLIFVLEMIACISLLVMMLLTGVDVMGRYVFGKPLPGTIELVQYAMVLVVFAGLPSVTLRRQHISVSLLDQLRGRPLRLQRSLAGLLSAAILSTQGVIVFSTAQTMREQADVIGFLGLSVHPAAYFMSALSLVAAAVCLAAVLMPSVEGFRTADPAH